ncbi:DUF92 domain-containing protein [Natronomonas sp. EA1]|uniref:DUF92 domain-containing protein n=1 Tax=Natronomonas sp. EA1 TaxID=3421655 RepID=UPI003EB868FE
MTGNVRRASVFAVVGLLALVSPAVVGRLATLPATAVASLPFVAVAAAALYGVSEGRVFELLARPGDYEDGKLYGLAGFALAAAALAILAGGFGLPTSAYVGAVFVLGGGNLASELAKTRWTDDVVATSAFAVGGALAGIAGQAAALTLLSQPLALAPLTFLATVGALTGGLLRAVLYERDDPLVMISIALLLWLFVSLEVTPSPTRMAVGLAVTVLLGYVAYALGTASVAGMVTGVLLALLAIVLGGYGWFALLITFFGLGGLASKFRYEEKETRGIAEANEGARGSGNVLANSAVALFAVIGFAASDHVGLPGAVFRFAFAGAVATALADTFSSEFGGLYDNPRLITTFERVSPGTDGAVTWQGELAGLVGAGLIAGIAAVFFALTAVETAAVLAGGFVGMTADSLLGATVEGDLVDNQGVNFLATLAGALACAAVVLL